MNGVVRIRQQSVDMGDGFRVLMYVVTGTGDRKRYGPRHLDQQQACAWVHAQGLRHIGSCWADREALG